MQRLKSRLNLPLFSILLTAFIDLLGWGIVIPILPAFFLDSNSSIFPAGASLSTRSIILGLLLAAYPFTQFIGAPILGALSDRFGRKKVLLISMVGTLIGYVLFGLGILSSSLLLLFVSRLLDGFTGGNISSIYAAVADISSDKEKPHKFGLVGMAAGLGLILGPFIGGRLSTKEFFHLFHYAAPFWFVACLTLVNIFFVIFQFPETLKERIDSKIDPLVGLRNIAKASKIASLRNIFVVSFILAFGFNVFVQFFAVYLINKFKMDSGTVGNLFAYVGIWIAITQGVITGLIAKHIHVEKVLPISILLLALSIVVLVFPANYNYMLILLPFVAIFYGLVTPNITAVISTTAGDHSQGEVMGINQSLNSLSQIIPPIVGGFMFSISVDLPIVFAGVCMLVAWYLLRKTRGRVVGAF